MTKERSLHSVKTKTQTRKPASEMSLDEIVSRLSLVSPFAILDKEQLKLIAFACEEIALESGQILMAKGEIAEGAYVLVEGALSAEHAGTGNVEKISVPGTVIAELALLGNSQDPPLFLRAPTASFYSCPDGILPAC